VQALSDREVAPGLLGPVLFFALLAASVGVAAIVLHARSPDLAIQVNRMPKQFSPNGDGRHDVAHIRFFSRESDPSATVEIVGPDLKPIRTLAADRPLTADEPVAFSWDGRTESGTLANPRNRYRLRVRLPDRDRDIVYPRRIAIRGARQ
jgi:hypothetical protein